MHIYFGCTRISHPYYDGDGRGWFSMNPVIQFIRMICNIVILIQPMAFAAFYKTHSRAIPAARAARRWFTLASERELRLDRLDGEYQGVRR